MLLTVLPKERLKFVCEVFDKALGDMRVFNDEHEGTTVAFQKQPNAFSAPSCGACADDA